MTSSIPSYGSLEVNVRRAISRIQTDYQQQIDSLEAALTPEYGSNSNGQYVKFADGTMICWRRHTVTDQAISSAYGAMYTGTRGYSFPVAFTAVPTVTVGEAKYGSSASWGWVDVATASTFTARFMDGFTRATGTSMTISWVAVGRWS